MYPNRVLSFIHIAVRIALFVAVNAAGLGFSSVMDRGLNLFSQDSTKGAAVSTYQVPRLSTARVSHSGQAFTVYR